MTLLRREHGRRNLVLLFACLAGLKSHALASAPSHLSDGITAYQEKKWHQAMERFLLALRENPADAQAHAYVALTVQRLGLERQTQEPRDRARWQALCDEARLERLAGRLPAAHDLLLQVLAQASGFPEAQRELRLLQSEVRRLMERGGFASIMERYALEGYYAYAQADFAGAVASWEKLRTFASLHYAGRKQEEALQGFRFFAYEAAAKKYVAEQERRERLQTEFDSALSLYQQQLFGRALEAFRRLAVLDPEYPQLGYYLTQTEAALEQQRTQRLGRARREELERQLRQARAALEQDRFEQALDHLERALQLDPAHPEARTYRAMARAEWKKQHDPRVAQMHYDAGLISYASGKLDEALRHWRSALRMNPDFEKARIAIGKVEKELALHRQEGARYEALP